MYRHVTDSHVQSFGKEEAVFLWNHIALKRLEVNVDFYKYIMFIRRNDLDLRLTYTQDERFRVQT